MVFNCQVYTAIMLPTHDNRDTYIEGEWYKIARPNTNISPYNVVAISPDRRIQGEWFRIQRDPAWQQDNIANSF